MARDEWFRSPAWDEQIEAAFEQRLPRARPYNQPQYIRIQATHLLSSPDPRVREAGRALLQRVITTFPDGSEARTAMEQLGGSLADEGRLGEAEQALRETLRMCAQSPAGRSATSGIAELRLAEVILAGDDAGRAGEAASLLEAIRPHVQTQRFLRDVVFRYLLASVRAPGSGTIRACVSLPAQRSRLRPRRHQRCHAILMSDVPGHPTLTSLN